MLENQSRYLGFGITALVINLVVVVPAIYRIVTKHIHEDNDGKGPIWDPEHRICSTWKVIRLLGKLIACLLDSIFDSIYFMRLKTKPRMIHVPKYVHVVQGFILFTGKFLKFRDTVINLISAILKDCFAAWAVRRIVRKEKDENFTVMGNYLMFLACFYLEDLGQLLCQECLRLIYGLCSIGSVS